VPLARAVPRARTFLAPRDEAAGGALSGLPPAAGWKRSVFYREIRSDDEVRGEKRVSLWAAGDESHDFTPDPDSTIVDVADKR